MDFGLCVYMCALVYARRCNTNISHPCIELLLCTRFYLTFYMHHLTESSFTDEETDSESLGHLFKLTQNASESSFTDLTDAEGCCLTTKLCPTHLAGCGAPPDAQ